MMTLLFAVFVVLFAISSVNTSKVKILKQSLQEAFSGGPLRRRGDDGDGQREAERVASSPPLPSLTPRRRSARAIEREDQERRRPTARSRTSRRSSAASTSSSRGRPDRQGLDDRPRRGLKGAAADRQVLFDSGSRPSSRRRSTCSTRSATSSRARRRTRSSSKATPTTSRSRLRIPVQLGAVRRARRGGRPAPRDRGVSRRRTSRAGYADAAPDRHNATAFGRAKKPPGRDHPDPSAWSNRNAGAATMKKKLIIIVLVLLVVLGGAYKFVLAKPKAAEQPSRRSTARSTSSEGVPRQPRRRPLRQAVGGARPPAHYARPAPPAATRAPTPPEGFGTIAQEAVVRDIITDELGAKDRDSSSEGPREDQEAHPQYIHEHTDVHVEEILFPDFTVQ